MQAIWIGTPSALLETVLLGLQSRWPHAGLFPSQSPRQLAQWAAQETMKAAFVHLKKADAPQSLEGVQAVRQASALPILALADESCGMLERVKALHLGCDGVIPADCGPIEIQAHLAARLRRAEAIKPESQEPIQAGDLVISPEEHEVRLTGKEIDLTPTEFRLLCALARRRGSIASHDALAQEVWGGRLEGGNTLRKHVERVRKKLGDDARRPQWVVSVPGVGYRLSRPRRADVASGF